MPAGPTGLVAGRYPCSFQDKTGSYNRSCVVEAQADGSLSLKARGTKLNPNNGFSGTLTGGPESYAFQGKISGFDNCQGSFQATTSHDGKRYVAKAKLGSGCSVTIRLKAPLDAGAAAATAPATSGAHSAGALTAGKHRCSFTDSTGTYNRVCTLQQSGSIFALKAPGTKLNPHNGFYGSITGSPDSYTFKGKVTGFDKCIGTFTMSLDNAGAKLRGKTTLDSGCPITIQLTSAVM